MLYFILPRKNENYLVEMSMDWRFYFYILLTGESGSKPQNGEYEVGLCVVFCLVLVVQWLFRAAIIASKPQLCVANP